MDAYLFIVPQAPVKTQSIHNEGHRDYLKPIGSQWGKKYIGQIPNTLKLGLHMNIDLYYIYMDSYQFIMLQAPFKTQTFDNKGHRNNREPIGRQ